MRRTTDVLLIVIGLVGLASQAQAATLTVTLPDEEVHDAVTFLCQRFPCDEALTDTEKVTKLYEWLQRRARFVPDGATFTVTYDQEAVVDSTSTTDLPP